MAFYKQKNIVGRRFRVEYEDSMKKFAIWDNTNKRVLKPGDTITLSDGQTQTINEGINLSEEDKKRYRYMISYVRKVNFPDEEDTDEGDYVGFSKTVEDQISMLVKNFKEAGIDYSSMDFYLKKVTDMKYEVSSKKPSDGESKKEESSNEQEPKQNFQGIKTPNIEEEQVKGDELTDKERKIVDAFIKAIKDYNYDPKDDNIRATYISGIVDNGVEEGRAKKLYDNYILNAFTN